MGLDPYMGFMHMVRSGRRSLGLDMMEELRPIFGDRLALALVNKRQLSADYFSVLPGGEVRLTENGRKTVIREQHEAKQREIMHPVIKEKICVGQIPYAQALLLARTIRGDFEEYTPFTAC